MIYFMWSLKYAPLAGPNPVGRARARVGDPSPPPTENFAATPIVTHGTHQYAPSHEVGIV
jgi:cytochrome c oxidase subunit 1